MGIWRKEDLKLACADVRKWWESLGFGDVGGSGARGWLVREARVGLYVCMIVYYIVVVIGYCLHIISFFLILD